MLIWLTFLFWRATALVKALMRSRWSRCADSACGIKDWLWTGQARRLAGGRDWGLAFRVSVILSQRYRALEVCAVPLRISDGAAMGRIAWSACGLILFVQVRLWWVHDYYFFFESPWFMEPHISNYIGNFKGLCKEILEEGGGEFYFLFFILEIITLVAFGCSIATAVNWINSSKCLHLTSFFEMQNLTACCKIQ